mgnify:CR=1 FL=1
MQTIQQTALKHIWYPCSQMKDYQDLPPIFVKKAQGSYLYLDDDTKIIDAISSWWCKSLGHQHPLIKKSIIEQLDKFEHIIGTNTISQTLTELSQKLSQLQPNLNKVFYAGDGSCAIEVAMKMSLHSRKLLGQNIRTDFISLSNGYHGETLATLSVSDVGLYKSPYKSLCFDCIHLGPLPYVSGENDPLWLDASHYWPAIEKQLEPYKNTATAILFEPILQGAGGMKIYSADLLKRLANYAAVHNIHLIADEIMTGLGRTGKTLACEHADITPDFICLSKALTAGSLAMSAILTSQTIYDLFYDDYATGKSFLHSNTYGGNALAAAAANAALDIHYAQNMNEQAILLGKQLLQGMCHVQSETGALSNLRQIGAMVAADLNLPIARAGFRLFKEAMRLGAFLRPLGNTLYWLPPLNTPFSVIEELCQITLDSIKKINNG